MVCVTRWPRASRKRGSVFFWDFSPMGSSPSYSRILLKVSGEALMGSKEFGIDLDMAGRVE